MKLEEQLFDDTRELSHTRGVPLLDLCRLCVYVFSIPGYRMSITELGRIAQDSGLKDFQGFSSQRIPRTRVRHYWYTLDKLGLMVKKQIKAGTTFELLENGKIVAEIMLKEELAYGSSIQHVAEASERLRAELARVVVESEYLREVWLSLFMSDSNFTYKQFLNKSQSIVIERLFPDYRLDMSNYGEDSGYRLYPYSKSAFERLAIAGNQGKSISASPNASLILSETARKEIHDGLRRWTYIELGITNETPLAIHGEERDVVETRRDVWVVKRTLSPGRKSVAQVAEWTEEVIRSIGNGRRIRTPELIVELCRLHSISLSNAKMLLKQLHGMRSDRFYFEGASESVIMDKFSSVPNPDDYYLIIDGIWRPTLLLLD